MRPSFRSCGLTLFLLLGVLLGACAPIGGRSGGAESPATVSATEVARTYVYAGIAAGELATFSLDQASGRLRGHGTIALGPAPTSLAAARDGRILVAASDAAASVVSLAINPKTGALTVVGRAASGGAQPGSTTADGSGKYVAVANQGSGTVAVLPVRPNGSLAAASVFDAGNGARGVAFHPSNEAAYVANFRAETISQYSFNIGTGTLTPKADRPVVLPAHSGPRSLIAHPSGRWLYVLNETSSTIAAYAIEEPVRTLSLLALQVASTLPDGWHKRKNQIVEARLGRGGRFLYAINRGHDSLVTFAVDRASGDLSLVGHQSLGQSPSALAVDPGGDFLFVAQPSGRSLASFRLDPVTGAPTPLGTVPVAGAPLSILAVRPSAD